MLKLVVFCALHSEVKTKLEISNYPNNEIIVFVFVEVTGVQCSTEVIVT